MNTFKLVRPVAAAFLTLASEIAEAQTNAWTSPASGRWEDSSWSLGAPPSTNHSVFITNSNSKAVAIYNSTPANTLTITNLFIDAPPGYANTLLLNFSGFGTPLRILDGCTIRSNGAIVNLYGALTLQRNLPYGYACSIEGRLQQEGGSWTADNVWVFGGTISNLNSGTTIRSLELSFDAIFNQVGGNSSISNLSLGYGSDYHLNQGTLTGTVATMRGSSFSSGAPLFNNNGGTHACTNGLSIYAGRYNLTSGTFLGNLRVGYFDGDTWLGGNGDFVQQNGFVDAGQITVGWSEETGYYGATNATIKTGSLGISHGLFTMWGGTLTATNTIDVWAFAGNDYYYGWTSYFELGHGFVSCSNFNAYNSVVTHHDGTNSIKGLLSTTAADYKFYQGAIFSGNSQLSRFQHYAGVHFVTNELGIFGDYILAGGTLRASNIRLVIPNLSSPNAFARWFTISNGSSTPVIINPGTFFCDGNVRLIGSTQQLGAFVLSGNSTFDFAQSPSELQFLDSHTLVWTNGAMLTVSNWAFGSSRLVIGNSASGITPAQLAQIRFVNPAGIPSAQYTAVILSSGEIVPSLLINSWTSSASGNWHDLTWSQGVRPTNSYSIFITNANSKAIGIHPTTPTSFPESMTIRSLLISAPNGSTNTLLLNFSGTNNPLHILESCVVDKNGIIDNQFGGLLIDGAGPAFVLKGILRQEGGRLSIPNGSLSMGSGSLAAISNSVCVLQSLYSTNGLFIQAGGVVSTEHIGITDGGQYKLINGILYGSMDLLPGSFKQIGGTNFCQQVFSNIYSSYTSGLSMYYPGASYELSDGTFVGKINVAMGYFAVTNGTIHSDDLFINTEGRFLQKGGVVDADRFIAWSDSFCATTNGTNHAQSLSVGGSFIQSGGTQIVVNNLDGNYTLASGFLASSNFNSGNVQQAAGTNSVDHLLSAGGYFGIYRLDGGTLKTSNTYSRFTYSETNGFLQNGGLHLVKNTLTNEGIYALNGGTLSASNIVMQEFYYAPFTILAISNSTPSIVNPGIFQMAGKVILAGSTQQLGTLVLSGNSVIDFTQTPGQLRFLNSSAAPWNNTVTLTISNWVGFTSGNGSNRLVVGNNATGLTAPQLGQLRFVNPSGLPAGTYFADLLSTGEVVPSSRIYLFSSKVGNKLIFNWPGTLTLESATNAHGPYATVPAATSPYTNSFTEPRRFFRLKKP